MKTYLRPLLTVIASATLHSFAGAADLLEDAQKGGLEIRSISSLSFAKDGVLLLAEPATASVVAVRTGDLGPFTKLAKPVADVTGTVAAGLGTTAENITIKDLAVNPASGRIYLSVQRKPDNAVLVVVVDSTGSVSPMALTDLDWVRVTLPGGTASKVTNITDIAFDGEKVFASGTCNEEFASRIFTLPVPIKHGATASVYSAETFHVAHNRWETKAPIQSFIPYHTDEGQFVVGAFACTPVAKFRVDDIQSGAQVKGVSMVELGSGNRPLDLFSYQDKSGKDWLVVHTQRFQKNLFGPSAFWAARVDMDYLDGADEAKTNKNAPRRDVKATQGPKGIEIVDALFGALQVDKLGTSDAVVLRETDGKQSLEVVALPN